MTTSTSSVSATSNGSAAQVSGLVSGIDTSSLIDSFIAVEARSQTALKNTLSLNQVKQSVLTSLNASLASLKTAAQSMADGTSTLSMLATSSTSAVTATVTGTPPGVALNVAAGATAVIASQVEVLGTGSSQSGGWVAPASNDSNSPATTFTFRLTAPGGTAYTLTAATTSAADVAEAINQTTSGTVGNPPVGPTGVSAALIVDGSGKQHLSLTGAPSTTSGADQSIGFTWTDSSSNAQTSGYAGAASGSPAALTVNGVALKSSTNTFKSVIDGLDLTLNPPQFGGSGAPATTVTTTLDTSAVAKSTAAVVTSLQAALSSIKLQLTAPPSGIAPSVTAGGLFAGDAGLRSVYNALSAALATYAGETVTSSTVGPKPAINLDSNGNASVDTTALQSYLTSNPAASTTLLKKLGAALQTAAAEASSPTLGTITQQITSISTANSRLTSDISDWDTRLQQRRATLQKQFTAMETMLQKLQSQSQTLTQQLNSLTKND